jgi:hypothetical protein
MNFSYIPNIAIASLGLLFLHACAEEPFCGNGIIDSDDEECDYGSGNPDEGCQDCRVVRGWSCGENYCWTVCGDGVHVESQEECDPGSHRYWQILL